MCKCIKYLLSVLVRNEVMHSFILTSMNRFIRLNHWKSNLALTLIKNFLHKCISDSEELPFRKVRLNPEKKIQKKNDMQLAKMRKFFWTIHFRLFGFSLSVYITFFLCLSLCVCARFFFYYYFDCLLSRLAMTLCLFALNVFLTSPNGYLIRSLLRLLF